MAIFYGNKTTNGMIGFYEGLSYKKGKGTNIC